MTDEVLFISDLHLTQAKPEISHNFLHFLKTRAQPARVLYILGDLFETWLGDDEKTEPFADIFTALQRLSASTDIYFMHGNRDFLVSQQFTRKLAIQLISDPQIIQLGKQRIALMHGDTLCSDDKDYQQFRQMVRNADWQQQFLAKSLSERRAMASQYREQSVSATSDKTDEIMDVNAATVSDRFEQLQVDTLIHGHTHRPGIHAIAQGRQRIVLGDWNPDPSYLSWKHDEFELVDTRL